MINYQLLYQYILEKKITNKKITNLPNMELLRCERFNIIDSLLCNCGSVGNSHQSILCEYWDLNGICDTTFICIDTLSYNDWVSGLRDSKIDQII